MLIPIIPSDLQTTQIYVRVFEKKGSRKLQCIKLSFLCEIKTFASLLFRYELHVAVKSILKQHTQQVHYKIFVEKTECRSWSL
jgi:hypothetical protein